MSPWEGSVAHPENTATPCIEQCPSRPENSEGPADARILHTAVANVKAARGIDGGRDVDLLRVAARAQVIGDGLDRPAVAGDGDGRPGLAVALEDRLADGHVHAAWLVLDAAGGVRAVYLSDPGHLARVAGPLRRKLESGCVGR